MYILMYVFWLLLCGRVTAEVLLLGIAVVALCAGLEYVLFGYTPADEKRTATRAPLLIAYIFVLVWEIFKANIAVSRIIINKNHKVTPTLMTFHTDISSDFGRFLLANSITLTPGTITVRVEGDKLTVHCLDGAMLDCSENGVFQRWIRRLEA